MRFLGRATSPTLLLLEGLPGRRKRVSCDVNPESWDEIEERRIICGPRLLAAATACDIDLERLTILETREHL